MVNQDISEDIVEAFINALDAQPVLREIGNRKLRFRLALESVAPLIAEQKKEACKSRRGFCNMPGGDT